jgi:hypothetical protein
MSECVLPFFVCFFNNNHHHTYIHDDEMQCERKGNIEIQAEKKVAQGHANFSPFLFMIVEILPTLSSFSLVFTRNELKERVKCR